MGTLQSIKDGEILELDAFLKRGWLYSGCDFESDDQSFPVYRRNGQRCLVKNLENERVEIIHIY